MSLLVLGLNDGRVDGRFDRLGGAVGSKERLQKKLYEQEDLPDKIRNRLLKGTVDDPCTSSYLGISLGDELGTVEG